MSRGSEFTGKNVEAAIVEAESHLSKSREELEIQVLSQGSRGVFGLGGEPARVLARDPNAPGAAPTPMETVTEERRERPRQRERPAQAAAGGLRSSPAAVLEEEAEAEPALAPSTERPPKAKVDPNEVAETAKGIVGEMLEKMGFEVEVNVRSVDEPITLDVSGENLGVLIGRRGDSLAALQFMVNVILSNRFRHWPRVVVDVQGYRSRREQSLSSLGQRVADRVRRNRRPFTLEAMPANDRRIIHLSLRDRNDIETYSIGEGPSRRVVIAPRK